MEWDDEAIAAYSDGELHTLVQYRFEDALARDVTLRARLERERKLKGRVSGHFDEVLEEPVPAPLLAMLGNPGGAEIVRIGQARHGRRLTRSVWVPAALAASLVLGLFGGKFLAAPGGVSEMPVAGGELARVLDTQLASAPAQEATTRVGVTFRDGDGRVCRTFDGSEVAGLACREERGWQLEMITRGSGLQGEGYQQASSGSMLVLQSAQERMAGEPFDEIQERTSRGSGWR
jgi:hypothetical protein